MAANPRSSPRSPGIDTSQPPTWLATGQSTRTREEDGEIVFEIQRRGTREWIELKRCDDRGRGNREVIR